jgi:hypothetical protein
MYNVKMIVLEEEWKMKMFEGSFKPLMKNGQIRIPKFQKGFEPKNDRIWKRFLMEVISKDVSFSTSITLLNLEF